MKGRKKRYAEATITVAFRIPASKEAELKEAVKAMQESWQKPKSALIDIIE